MLYGISNELSHERVIRMPKIPEPFLDNARIASALYFTIEEFDFQEKALIFLYCYIGMTIYEVAALTKLAVSYVESILTVYAFRLKQRVDVFRKAAHCHKAKQVSVYEMFEREAMEFMANAV